MTVYGRPDNALADDEAPAKVPPCLFHPYLSVCLLLFLLSFSAFSHSFLSPALSLALFLFSAEPHLAQLPWILQPFPLLSPE